MDPIIGASLLSAGSSLLGGLFDRSQRKKDAYAISPAGIRKNSEAAGFNPLVFAGAQQSLPYGPVFGSAIANAASAGLATYQSGKRLELSEQRLQMDNKRLTQQLEKATLTPVVGSKVYPTKTGKLVPDALGNNTVHNRPERIAPTDNLEGRVKFNNFFTFGDVSAAGSDGEPFGVSELIALTLQAGPQIMWNGGKALGRKFLKPIVDDFRTNGLGPLRNSLTEPYKSFSSSITNQPATELNSQEYRRSTSNMWK